MGTHIRRRRKNGQFAGSLTLPSRAPQLAPPPAPTTPTPHTDTEQPTYCSGCLSRHDPDKCPHRDAVSLSGPSPSALALTGGISPSRRPTKDEVCDALHLAGIRLRSAEDNVSDVRASDLSDARQGWKAAAEICEKYDDIAASDAFYEVISVSDKLSDYLSRTPVFDCHHPNEDECEECHHPDVEELIEEIIADYSQ